MLKQLTDHISLQYRYFIKYCQVLLDFVIFNTTLYNYLLLQQT